MCGTLWSEHISMFFFFSVKTAIYRTESHPLMVFDLKQEEQRESKEAGRRFEPHGHHSAGGPHACTQTDNEGRKRKGELEEVVEGMGREKRDRCAGGSGAPDSNTDIQLLLVIVGHFSLFGSCLCSFSVSLPHLERI